MSVEDSLLSGVLCLLNDVENEWRRRQNFSQEKSGHCGSVRLLVKMNFFFRSCDFYQTTYQAVLIYKRGPLRFHQKYSALSCPPYQGFGTQCLLKESLWV